MIISEFSAQSTIFTINNKSNLDLYFELVFGTGVLNAEIDRISPAMKIFYNNEIEGTVYYSKYGIAVDLNKNFARGDVVKSEIKPKSSVSYTSSSDDPIKIRIIARERI